MKLFNSPILRFGRRATLLPVILLSLTLVQCGKKGDSDNVEITVIPGEPIVITADTEIDDEDVKAPWYAVRFSVSNKTEQTLTLVGFEYTNEGLDEAGNPVLAEGAASASDFNVDIKIGDATCSYEFINFDPIAPGTTSELTVTDLFPEGSVPATDDDPAINCPPLRNAGIISYITGPDEVVNYRYKVTMRPLGWFGTPDEANDRFEKKVIFRTR